MLPIFCGNDGPSCHREALEALGRFEPEVPPPDESIDAASATAAALGTASAANGGMAIEDESSLENGSIVNMQVRTVARGYNDSGFLTSTRRETLPRPRSVVRARVTYNTQGRFPGRCVILRIVR